MANTGKDFIWSALVHIGTRMWHDHPGDLPPALKFDELATELL